ncbi:MAG: hypothetical protein AB7E98_11865 [Pirellulales bacterium]
MFATFDRNIIKSNWRAINESPLKKAGLLIRRIALNSLKTVKHGRPSAPLRPPHSHAWRFENKGGKVRKTKAPLKLIYSVPEALGSRVVIGPVGFNTRGIPGRLEHGASFALAQKQRLALLMKIKRGDKSVPLMYRRRAKRMTIDDINPIAQLAPRPFMGPAEQKARPKLPALWHRSLN